jgi:hypothetical protein
MLLHCLELELELSQVGFQLFDLLGFGQKAALEAVVPAAAFTAAVAGLVPAITIFVHIHSPLDRFIIKFRFLRFLLKRLVKPNKYILFLRESPHADQPVIQDQAGIDDHRRDFFNLGEFPYLGNLHLQTRILLAQGSLRCH